MSMSHRERLEIAWSFNEPDRVPIEIKIAPYLHKHPLAKNLMNLINKYASNFATIASPGFGFMGFPSKSYETVIEENENFTRNQKIQETSAGTFTAITYHPKSTNDFHWEKRFISTLEDFEKIALSTREPVQWSYQKYKTEEEKIENSAYPLMHIFHPLGTLARNSELEESYSWFYSVPKLMHEFLTNSNNQVIKTIKNMQEQSGNDRLTFYTAAHEMLIPPWMGHKLFDEFVFPYDKSVYDTIHSKGGRFRSHCHGNCGDFLEKFVKMGVDSIEPLEHLPTGDVNLAEAKKKVGKKMLLSGNIASEHFCQITADEVREQVKKTINIGAPGGGFTLRTSGGYAGTSIDMTDDILKRTIKNIETYILAGLEYGKYPIK